jgi:hypothetical protein
MLMTSPWGTSRISHHIGGEPGTSTELALTARPILSLVLAGSSVLTPSTMKVYE